jgi:hypothetical protein
MVAVATPVVLEIGTGPGPSSMALAVEDSGTMKLTVPVGNPDAAPGETVAETCMTSAGVSDAGVAETVVVVGSPEFQALTKAEASNEPKPVV